MLTQKWKPNLDGTIATSAMQQGQPSCVITPATAVAPPALRRWGLACDLS